MLPHPWFNPLWRRIATSLFCIGWTLIEIVVAPTSLWVFVAAAFAGWTTWDFFLSRSYPVEPSPD